MACGHCLDLNGTVIMKTWNCTAPSSLFLLVSLGILALPGCSAKVNGIVSMGEDTGGTAAIGGGPGLGSTGGSLGTGGTSAGPSGGQCGAVSGLTGGMALLTDTAWGQISNSACAVSEFELDTVPPLVDFIVDVSGSMMDVSVGSSGQDKWQVTQAALSNAIQNELPNSAGVGILLYPNMNTVPNNNDTVVPPIPLATDTCVNTSALIPVAPLGAAGSAQRTAIAQGLTNAYVAGGTPTDDAYEFTYNSSVVPTLQTYAYYTPNIVLITDGQPTISLGCEGTGQEAHPVDWHPIVNDIATAFAATPSVKTYIIGLPGSQEQSYTGADGRPWLSLAARTGGTLATPDCQDTGPNYCHFDMSQSADFAAGLAQALSDVISDIAGSTASLSCSFSIPTSLAGQTIDPNAINVIYKQNGSGATPQSWLIGESNPCCGGGNGDGWYMDSNSGKITLCPFDLFEDPE